VAARSLQTPCMHALPLVGLGLDVVSEGCGVLEVAAAGNAVVLAVPRRVLIKLGAARAGRRERELSREAGCMHALHSAERVGILRQKDKLPMQPQVPFTRQGLPSTHAGPACAKGPAPPHAPRRHLEHLPRGLRPTPTARTMLTPLWCPWDR
jgi:hypothetical protein